MSIVIQSYKVDVIAFCKLFLMANNQTINFLRLRPHSTFTFYTTELQAFVTLHAKL